MSQKTWTKGNMPHRFISPMCAFSDHSETLARINFKKNNHVSLPWILIFLMSNTKWKTGDKSFQGTIFGVTGHILITNYHLYTHLILINKV